MRKVLTGRDLSSECQQRLFVFPGCMAGDNYVEQIEDVLRHCVAKKGVAGFFAESIQGEVAVSVTMSAR